MWDAKAVDDMPVPQVFSPPRITEALETLVLAGENSKKQKILSAPVIVALTSEKPPWDNYFREVPRAFTYDDELRHSILQQSIKDAYNPKKLFCQKHLGETLGLRIK